MCVKFLEVIMLWHNKLFYFQWCGIRKTVFGFGFTSWYQKASFKNLAVIEDREWDRPTRLAVSCYLHGSDWCKVKTVFLKWFYCSPPCEFWCCQVSVLCIPFSVFCSKYFVHWNRDSLTKLDRNVHCIVLVHVQFWWNRGVLVVDGMIFLNSF